MQRTAVVAGVVAVLFVGTIAMPVAGSGASASTSDRIDAHEPAVHVELEADGDATVTLVSVYDLTDDDERDAFESLRNDDDARAELLDRFADRLDAVAADLESDVDRETSVVGDDVDARTDDDRGIVALSVTWNGLAALEEDTLVLTEPFASGFESDRTLVVTVPEDATIESATPEPTSSDGIEATWESGTDLSGFELTASTETADGDANADEASDGLPGFGGVAAIIALAVSLFAVVKTRR
ncbi:hypothetical protein RBH26_03635 [Natronolimnohabitans sp. A-GB9]|uniref:DUF7345 domain-containing protein n=1 Tax=Natronolimnohabitans sp. A-GB9 TaxID=3069757 RepID=UPI0027B32BF9|nr:hypothetical protein [Natronolimnohabitans sp. A-GB9]MDQ2049567.1 hypothetical protein [Natronolimnohabitans sp. A-GB9]